MNYKNIVSKYVRNKYAVIIASVCGILLLVIPVLAISRSSSSDDVINPSSKNKLVEIAGSDHKASQKSNSSNNSNGEVLEYDFSEASEHIGEKVIIKGVVKKIFTSKSGVTFFDFCDDFSDCPFSAVIFASDLEKFGDLTEFERAVKITGTLKSYQGKAEIVLNKAEQIE